MKYPPSCVAAEHTHRMLLSVSFAYPALHCESRTQHRGWCWAQMGQLHKQRVSKAMQEGLLPLCVLNSPHKPIDSRSALWSSLWRSQASEGSGEVSLSGKPRGDCTLGRENGCLLGLLPAFTNHDRHWSNPGSCPLHEAKLRGDSGWLVRGGRVAEIMTRLGCVPAKSTHVTWHPVAGLDLWQPTAITLRLVLGKGGKTSWSRFTEPFPQGWKMKCHRGPGVLILRGHKIVRAIATPINKTWGVSRRERKLWRYSKKNHSVIWVSSHAFRRVRFFIF